ncbi:MAG TPA: thioredoxin domain-containing protein, partial [Gemmatimonadaceae bacterium]|nr:thioredoxin domain-containing protein [Gemmatimonadaceae bacterium]
ETSPYLLQHAENPVDWHPWGPDALERARQEDRPILLSVGYAACHWCHVMAHESFEDPETARLMNELFVNVKVDREERPDVDAVYMQAVQAMTGQGGWPMTVFLTPTGDPFYGGTYFPPVDRQGMPAFRRVLAAVAESYRARPEGVARTVEALRDMYRRTHLPAAPEATLGARTLAEAAHGLAQQFDPVHGGFGGAPKFPNAMALEFLLGHAHRTGDATPLAIVRRSARAMARGGIYDQVGGGFHRYSVDAAWQVPHFEKMLYDNALLARLYLHVYQATADAEAGRVAEETIDWVAREMTSPEGGFYSALDADSEGEEGRFYVWDAAELDALLGDDAALARTYFGVTPGGNFEGRNILHVPFDADVAAARHGVTPQRLAEVVARAKTVLDEARNRRIRPGRDDKVLASWNGLMLRALALGAAVLGRSDWRALALRNGALLRRELVRDGRVLRLRPAHGARVVPGFLDDHAAVALGFLALYELTFDRRWLDDARQLAEATVAWFWDEELQAFHDTAHDAEVLITRPRDPTDNASPSGTSLAVELLLRLGDLLDDEAMRARGARVVNGLAEAMARYPSAFGHLLGATDLLVHGAVEVALVGAPGTADFDALAAEVHGHYLPSPVLAGGTPAESADIALLAGRRLQGGRATAYVCRAHACDAPVTEPTALGEQLRVAGTGR